MPENNEDVRRSANHFSKRYKFARAWKVSAMREVVRDVGKTRRGTEETKRCREKLQVDVKTPMREENCVAIGRRRVDKDV